MLIVQRHAKICVVNRRVLKYAHLRVVITARAVVRVHAPDLQLDLAVNVQTTVPDLVQGGVKMHAQQLVRNHVRVVVKDPVTEDAKDLVQEVVRLPVRVDAHHHVGGSAAKIAGGHALEDVFLMVCLVNVRILTNF